MTAPTDDQPAPRNKFEARRAATRRELLRLGIERFPARGYSATTVEDVVRDSALTRGAFYFHFASKEEFFLELLLARVARRAEWWQAAEAPGVETLEQAVAEAFRRLAEDGGPDDAAWIVLITDFSHTVRDEPRYREALRGLYDEWIVELSRFVEPLARRGLVRADRSVAELSAEVFATVEGHNLHARLYGADPAPAFDAVLRVLRP